MQLVQNSVARVVFPSTRRADHVSPLLRNLHWLPIRQRILYKISLITFKSLLYKSPSYLSDILHPYSLTPNLRSSSQTLLTVPAFFSLAVVEGLFVMLLRLFGILCLLILEMLCVLVRFCQPVRLISSHLSHLDLSLFLPGILETGLALPGP